MPCCCKALNSSDIALHQLGSLLAFVRVVGLVEDRDILRERGCLGFSWQILDPVIRCWVGRIGEEIGPCCWVGICGFSASKGD